jgi:hypothetical protein
MGAVYRRHGTKPSFEQRRQAILDHWMEMKLAREPEERRYWREMREALGASV